LSYSFGILKKGQFELYFLFKEIELPRNDFTEVGGVSFDDVLSTE